MRVAVVDVGSNTARLLVADIRPDGSIATVEEGREHLGLGAEIARTGTLSRSTVTEVARVCRGFARRARRVGVDRGETIVTAPGRQGRAPGSLVAALSDATALPVRVLTSDEEGRLAYDGALACAQVELPEVVAVVDVGGGSTEVVIGTPLLGAAWVRSIDLGSLRLAHGHLRVDPPRRRDVERAQHLVREALGELAPPGADLALATGGSARAVAKLVGRTLSTDSLDQAVRLLMSRPSRKVARDAGIHPVRAGTVLAGALLLGEVARALGRPMELARGGLREGAALSLASSPAVAAA